MHGDWPWALFLLMISPAVGSFLGVLVDRLQSLESLFAPSRCDTCKMRLGWQDMVPVVSWITLRGCCRACGAAIPGHLMRIEIAAMLAAVVVVIRVPGTADMWLYAITIWCLIALFYSDLLHYRLPDVLTLALFVLGLTLAGTDPARGWLDGLVSAGAALAAFWAIRLGYFHWRGREGLGLGDVKLMAGIGAAVGWAAVPVVTLLAALLALAVVAVQAIAERRRPDSDARLPFGSYLVAATAVILML